jgi:peptidyl-prolyl cis-trans isomerase D
MISWIQKYFQHHFRTIFALMLALMIISLVGFYNAAGGLGRGNAGRSQASEPFFGLDLAKPEDAQLIGGDAETSLRLQLKGDVPVQTYAEMRQASLWLADQFNLPAPGKAELNDFVRTVPLFTDPTTGQFDPARYNSILDSLATDPRHQLADVTRVLQDDARFAQVQRLLVGPGFLLPTEARALLDRDESSWTLGVATVDYASFAPAISTPAPAELENFFTANPARFAIDAQVRVDAIEFPAESFLSKVTVTDAEVRKFYDNSPTAFTPESKPDATVPALLAKPETKPADKAAKADADFAAALPKVEAALRLDRARRLAERAAADFAVTLFDQKITPATLDALLAARSLTLKPLAPFAKDAIPAELGTALDTAAAPFKLTTSAPFSDALHTGRGDVVLVWRENLPARQPAFAEVRDRVVAAWQADEKHRLFAELGRTLRTRFEAAVKAGTTLEHAVAEAADSASSAKLEFKNYSGFTLAQKRESGSFDALAPALDRLETLEKGELTDMITVAGPDGKTPEKGLLVLAVDKKLPDPAAPESLAYLRQVKTQVAAYSANQTLGELVQAELKKFAPAQP